MYCDLKFWCLGECYWITVPFARLSIRHVKIVLCMLECVWNYSIPTANGNMEGAATLAGAGMLNFLNIYVQQTPVNAHYSVDNSWFWCWFFCCIATIPIQTQFEGLTYTGQCYGIKYCCILKETNFIIALTVHLQSWRTGLKQINIQKLTICVTSSNIFILI